MTLPKVRRDKEEKLLAQGLKECRHCHVVKTLDNFGKKKKNPGGLDHWCRDCNQVMHSNYRSNPSNRAKELAVHLEWKAKNQDKLLAESRDWAAKNPERKKSLKKKWHEAHKESENAKARIRARAWAAENKDHHNKLNQDRRSREAGAEGSHDFEQWMKIVELTGDICPACGNPMKRPTLDHIIPLSWGGTHYLTNVQVLCKKCNSEKGDRFAADYRPLPARAWSFEQTYGTLDEGMGEQAALEWWVKVQAVGMEVEVDNV